MKKYNGWIKIEGLNDLPTKSGTYWVMDCGLVRLHRFNANDFLDTEYWIKYFTYYQKIKPPKAYLGL